MARRCFVSSCVRFCLAVQRALALSRSTWSIIGIQSPRPNGPMQTAANWMKSAKRIWQRYLNNNRTALLPAGVFAGRYAGAGYCGAARARGEQVAFLGLLDTWPPETKTGRKKRLMAWTRKCWRRLTRARGLPGGTTGKYFNGVVYTIEGNYADAVRLLTTAHSVPLKVKRRCLLLNAHFRKV